MNEPLAFPRFLSVALALGLWASFASGGFGQSAGPSSAPGSLASVPEIDFDVVSIHPGKNPAAPMGHAFPADSDSMTFTNVPLFILLFYVYNGDRAGLTRGLPGWTRTERYDITAKVTGPNVDLYRKLSQNERKLMLRRVLEDRFQLKVHRESRVMPVYNLVVAKGGSKLVRAQPADVPANGRTIVYAGPGQMSGHGVLMGDLAAALSDSSLGRQVIDKTRLTARYNFTLKFALDPGPAPSFGSQSGSKADDAMPSIFSALQDQLGLKLESSTAPVETLVVDHIEKPTEN